MKKIYVFGNPLVKEDSLPLKLIEKLKKEFPSLEFKEFDTVEDLELEKELNIIDTVKGIKKVELIEDIDKIITSKIYSLHDFDLGYNLKLLKEMKMIDKVRIFGIPDKMNEKEAIEQLKKLIRDVEINGMLEEFNKKLPKFPDGRIDYSKSDKAPTVNVFVSYRGKILLLKRSGKLKNYPDKWSSVTGYLDELKPVEEKVLEELKEEVNIGREMIEYIRAGDKFEFNDKSTGKTWIILPFIAVLKKEPKIKLDYENTEFEWVKPEEMAKLDTVPMLEKVFEKVREFL